jgi:hypothetical protein
LGIARRDERHRPSGGIESGKSGDGRRSAEGSSGAKQNRGRSAGAHLAKKSWLSEHGRNQQQHWGGG